MRLQWYRTLALAALCASLADIAHSQPAPDVVSSGKLLLPSMGWPCGMPGGIPVPEQGTQILEITLKLNQVLDVGNTPYGHRKVLIIEGGSVASEKLSAEVMSGGLDFELSFTNGTLEVEQLLVLKTRDGKYIFMRNLGAAVDSRDVRIVVDFEAPTASDYSWLNTGTYVGSRVTDLSAMTAKLTVFDNSKTPAESTASDTLRVTKPPGVVDQPLTHRTAAAGEKRGDLLITENVTLAPSQSVGATKNGGRNIIPITGGTVKGKITGTILAGGADYQKLANPVTLDARYLWRTEDGEVIIVHNAGPISSLVPTFEVRLDSKHAWLNQGTYLSSGPGMGAGGVSLTFYESTQ